MTYTSTLHFIYPFKNQRVSHGGVMRRSKKNDKDDKEPKPPEDVAKVKKQPLLRQSSLRLPSERPKSAGPAYFQRRGTVSSLAAIAENKKLPPQLPGIALDQTDRPAQRDRRGSVVATRRRSTILLASIEESRQEPPLIPRELPPSFADKVKKVSRRLGGAIFAFRGNSSAPAYEFEGYPKPPTVKGKLSNVGAVEGYLPVDDALYGKIDASGKVIRYPPHALPEDKDGNSTLLQVQLQRPLDYFMEGLNSKPPKFKLVGSSADEKEITEEIKKTGILRVSAVSPFENVNNVVYRIDLNSKETTPPIAGMKREKISSVEAEEFKAPEWYTGKEWATVSKQRFPVMGQKELDIAHEDPLKDKIMIYAMKGPENKAVPIIGDQDLLWITMPKTVYDALPHKELATHAIDTRRKETLEGGGTVPVGADEMTEALMQLDKDLSAINGAPPLFNSPLDIPDAVADWGTLTAYEAYAAILINKEFGIEFSHLLSLIQHGPENRTPYKPEDLNGNINHIGPDFVHQTNTEQELVDFVSSLKKFVENNIFVVHHGWDMEKWGPIVQHQIDLDQPVPAQTRKALEDYNKNFVSAMVMQEGSSFVEKPVRSLFSEDAKKAISDYAEKNGWKLDSEKNLMTKDKDVIKIKENGLHSNNGTPEVVEAMGGVFQAVKIPQKDLDLHGNREAMEKHFAKVSDAPDVNNSTHPALSGGRP